MCLDRRENSQTFVFWHLYLDVSILMVYLTKFGTVELPTSQRLVTHTHPRKKKNCRFCFSKCFDENLSFKYSRRHIWDLIVSSLGASHECTALWAFSIKPGWKRGRSLVIYCFVKVDISVLFTLREMGVNFCCCNSRG